MTIKFKKLDRNAVTPKKAHDTDAGFDLTAVSCFIDDDEGKYTYDTGIAVEIPKGYVGLVFPRSSVADRDLFLTNSVGVIDSGYRGSIKCKFKLARKKGTMFPIDRYQVGERVCQLIIIPYPEIEFEEVNELSDSDRGIGGYGSTGK